MKTYISSDLEQLTLTFLEEGGVQTSTFTDQQEFADFMQEHNVLLLVSNARNYSDLEDSEIVQQYEDLKTSLNI